jgi:hypothetical protein
MRSAAPFCADEPNIDSQRRSRMYSTGAGCPRGPSGTISCMATFAALAASVCLSAAVTYALASDPGAPAGVPWVRAGAVYGYLFYYGAAGAWKSRPDRALITTGGGVRGAYATKVLWHVRGGSLVITVSGQKLDGPGRFRQRFPETSTGGGGWFPSIVIVPSSGCWRLTVTSGRKTSRFAFVAVPPSSSSR